MFRLKNQGPLLAQRWYSHWIKWAPYFNSWSDTHERTFGGHKTVSTRFSFHWTVSSSSCNISTTGQTCGQNYACSEALETRNHFHWVSYSPKICRLPRTIRWMAVTNSNYFIKEPVRPYSPWSGTSVTYTESISYCLLIWPEIWFNQRLYE